MKTVLLLASLSIFQMGGDIRVPQAPDGASLRTMGGDIVVSQGAGRIVARTMGGNIEIRSLRGSAYAATMGGEIRVNVDASGPGHDVELSSMGGNVELRLPANFDGDFDIELEEGGQNQHHQITSDFPLNVRQSSRWRFFDGIRDVHIATGRSGSGVNRVQISTVGGNITIRKK